MPSMTGPGAANMLKHPPKCKWLRTPTYDFCGHCGRKRKIRSEVPHHAQVSEGHT